MASIDIVRLNQDEKYAKSLTRDQWHDLVKSPEWDLMAGENPELIAPIVQKYGDLLPLPSRTAGEGGFGPGTNKSLNATQ